MISFVGIRLASSCLAVVSIAPLAVTAQTSPTLNSTGLRASIGSVPAQPILASRGVLSPEMRGDIFMARKMYRDAIDMYRQGPQDSPVIINKIGIAFHQLMELDLARKSYQAALKLDPKYSEAINNLGTIYYAERRYKRAIGYYRRSLKYANSAASVYANLGAAYFARKDYRHASEYYEQALKLDPDVFERRGGFGTLMQERTITEIATFHLYLAKTYAKSGANERALIYLRKALEEGIKDRQKIPQIPEFNILKNSPDFVQLLAENPKPL